MVGVPFVALDLGRHPVLKQELLAAVARVLDHGQYVLGPEHDEFERRFAALCRTRFAAGVANGTTGLILALRALGIGPGHEVITAPNSFLASAAAIALVGARPVFVDVRDDLNIDPDLIEAAVTPCTRAILPVHLTGRPAAMDAIGALAARLGLAVVEDAAQAVGASLHGRPVGSFGAVGVFSLHPVKNLAACGDAGVITTDDETLHRTLTRLRNHGLRNRDECDVWSDNGRLDTMQAAILNVKLKHLGEWTARKRALAERYRAALRGVVGVPEERDGERCVYQTFVVRAERRDDLQRFLAGRGIDTRVHYPIPLHLQDAARDLGYRKGDLPVTERLATQILSLPIYPDMTDAQQEAVVGGIRAFYGQAV